MMDTSCNIYYKTDKKIHPKLCLGRINVSAVPPKFRNNFLLSIQYGKIKKLLPISLPLITVGISVGVY